MANLAPSPLREDGYPAPTPELRAMASAIEQRRLALSSQNAQLRARYDEVMRWVNPPWDSISRRADPRPEMALARRNGRPVIHADWTRSAIGRWAVLEMGRLPAIRVPPRYVPGPLRPPRHGRGCICGPARSELETGHPRAPARFHTWPAG